MLIMIHRPHVVALILARGGSKGIPKKNLAIIQNSTLLQRSLNTVNSCGRTKTPFKITIFVNLNSF